MGRVVGTCPGLSNIVLLNLSKAQVHYRIRNFSFTLFLLFPGSGESSRGNPGALQPPFPYPNRAPHQRMPSGCFLCPKLPIRSEIHAGQEMFAGGEVGASFLPDPWGWSESVGPTFSREAFSFQIPEAWKNNNPARAQWRETVPGSQSVPEEGGGPWADRTAGHGDG